MTGNLYLFQYGSFTQLSRAEAYAFIFKSKAKIELEGQNYLVFRLADQPDPYFGSIVRVAKYYSDILGFKARFCEEIEYSNDNAVKWTLYVLDRRRQVAQKLRSEVAGLIKGLGKKSIYVNPTPLFSEEGGVSLTKAIRAKLSTQGYEFVILSEPPSVWRTIKHLDLKGFRERDLGRPYQNPLISMPPWLARSMINLASPPKGGKLLDPFCGTGTILLEALDAGLHAYGVDINRANVEGARANLQWYSKRRVVPSFHVIKADSRLIETRFPKEYFDCVVTEPPFGPPFKSPAARNEVADIAGELVELYSQAFTGISKVLKKDGSVVFTLPAWRLKAGGIFELRAERVLKATDLELEASIGPASLPIKWGRPDNVILRLIYVARRLRG